ncbi:CCD63 protein, partial [Trogon melanurus]|nr:CCD63 protein [Trogon melanurus]
QEIESLTQEHKEVLLTLSQITSPRNVMLDDRNCTELQCLLQTKCQYDSLIRERRALLADMDNQILELEKKIVNQNPIAVKARQAKNSQRLQKQIEMLEKRLNTVTVRYDTILTRNSELLEEVKSLRVRKAVLGNIYLKLHEKLDQQRRRMNAAVEQTAEARKQRSEKLTRISDMNERRNREIIWHNIELEEKKRARDQESKLKTFMLTKFTDRSEREEQAKKRRALKAAQRAEQIQGESFRNLEKAYKQLLELAEDGDIIHLLNDLIRKEEMEFSCFSYATELNRDMEKMQQRIEGLQAEIMALSKDQEHKESSNLRVLKELEQKLTETTEEANGYEDKCKESSKLLGQLKSDMEALLKEMNCDTTKIMKKLGEKGEITDLNVMQFFGLVEKKSKELLMKESILRYVSSEDLESTQPFVSPLLGGSELVGVMDQEQLCLPPPALDGAIDAITDVEVPLEHGQLRQLVLQSFEKELGNATGVDKKRRNSVDV